MPEVEEQYVPSNQPSLRSAWQEALRISINNAKHAIFNLQHADGYWCFELEADATITAEYILMMHFMDEIDTELQARLASYIRSKQQDEGGWPLYYQGKFDMSCSVKAYYALKLAGDDIEAPHMRKARELILKHGGAARCNVFTRLALAMFGQIPWRGVPYVPAEIMLLPKWFPFHLSKVSYWTRTVLVPLTILYSLKASAINPGQVHIQELFTLDPEKEKNYFPVRSSMNWLFLRIERTIRQFEWAVPKHIRKKAIKRAEEWFVERLNGEDGLGAIFPAMVNAHEALTLLGYEKDHPFRQQTKKALEKLLVDQGEMAYCQPCVSPIWDTALAVSALIEDRDEASEVKLKSACEWLVKQQVTDQPGDWREVKPDVPGGGWAFQFANPHYPDLDDTGVVGWVMHDVDAVAYQDTIERAAAWISGMQSNNGGFAAFDVDNTYYLLNNIPFADHGALLDPPSSDVTARCVVLLAKYNKEKYRSVIDKAVQYLVHEQEASGAWFGRWGTNYIYGTWSVLVAFENAGIDAGQPMIKRAVNWLKSTQRDDGGWGESNDSYESTALAGSAQRSSAFQTAWALLGLMAAGEVSSHEVRQGIEFLLLQQEADGLWQDPEFTAPGFPRVFYLKYHGYDKFFPLWALARYTRLVFGDAPGNEH
jgi:squalene-hopene/tetraprenyl-beta-curcumene cyclase